jgi:hypothetical protein
MTIERSFQNYLTDLLYPQMSNRQQFFQILQTDEDQSNFLYCTNQRQMIVDDIHDIFVIDIDIELMFSHEPIEYLVGSYIDFSIA